MAHQSLYRRYRPRTFGEIVGQEHAVAALRNAAREGTAGHAYLFSGPRGTGKTSTARILAKALNCTDLQDGEPCGACASCVSVDSGTSVDLHEHDAASRRRIDEMRDLLGTIHLGTAGNRKVYILDEVHQLTKEAASAVLKVLEEPPAHVVWVLATTDPQKVPATIRSRTQHFEFGLLPPEQLEKHVRWVADDAGLTVADDAVPYVVREAKGSVRDALSALERVAAAGGTAPPATSVTEVVDALAADDVGAVLGAVARLVEAGRDPRQMASDLVGELRDAFLVQVAPELVRRPEADRAALADRARALGTSKAVRAMEVLGETLVALRDAPDARVLVEASLVRLASPDADTSAAALAERIRRLERRVEGFGPAPAGAAEPKAAASAGSARRRGPKTPSGSAPPAPSEAPDRPRPPPPLPGSPRGEATPEPPAPSAAATPSAGPTDTVVAESSPATTDRPPGTPTAAGLPSRDELTLVWGDELLDQMPRKLRARFSGGHFVEVSDGVATFALPNDRHRARAEEVQADVEGVLQARFGRPVPLRLVVDPGEEPLPGPENDLSDEAVDPTELEDAPGGIASGVATLTEVFPGAEVLDGDEEPG